MEFKYNVDDKVEYKEFERISDDFVVCVGYVVGYEYVVHPFEKEPTVGYAIVDKYKYQEYLNYRMGYTEMPNYKIAWIKEGNILRKYGNRFMEEKYNLFKRWDKLKFLNDVPSFKENKQVASLYKPYAKKEAVI